MAYTRKTEDEFTLLKNYGYGDGWEELTTEKTRYEINKRLKEYRAEEGGSYRISHKRVKINQNNSPNNEVIA